MNVRSWKAWNNPSGKVLFAGLGCWWAYRFVYRPFVQGHPSDAWVALGLAIIIGAVLVAAKWKAASDDFRRH